jgi:hypothetical protein
MQNPLESGIITIVALNSLSHTHLGDELALHVYTPKLAALGALTSA